MTLAPAEQPPAPAPRPARRRAGARPPLLLFGAFDRHNFGDLLLPHIAAAMLPAWRAVPTGLARRDLRAFGGHAVRPLAEVAAALARQRPPLLHVGGELLGCDAWQAAAMLLPPDEAPATIAHLATHPEARDAWVRRQLAGASAPAAAPPVLPYVVEPGRCAGLGPLLHAGIGGVGLASAPPAQQAAALDALRGAAVLQVRDQRTRDALRAAGLQPQLVPDPAVLVAALFGPRLRWRARRGEVAALRRTWPAGYLAVQCSADFADDATLDALADGLARVAARSGLALALWRAGAAPWHDDPVLLQRLAARLLPRVAAGGVRLFGSLQLWDIAALLAASQGFIGSSLHGRIVAMACGLPRLNLRPPAAGNAPDKPAAFAATWDRPDQPAAVPPSALAEAAASALAASPQALRRHAADLVDAARAGFDTVRRALPV